MNKVFSKIAGLSVGLALAIGVGVAVGGREARTARATEAVAYTLDGTIKGTGNSYAGEGTATQDGVSWIVNGNLTTDQWRIGTPKSGSAATRIIQSQAAVSSNNITKVVLSLGQPTKNAITPNGISMKVGTSIGGSQTSTLASQSYAESITFNRPANTDWSSKYFEIDFDMPSNSDTKNAHFIIFYSATFYHEVSGQSISAPSTSIVAVGKTVNLDVSYINIGEDGISVTSGAAVSVPAKLDVTGTGITTLSITGVSVAESVTVTLSAGTAQAEIDVSVIDPNYFYLVDDINKLTDGSRFTLIAENAGKLYYPYGFNSSGYYETNEVPVFGDGYVGVDGAIEYTLDFIDGEAYIMDGADYIGSSSVSSTAKIVLTEDHSANYNTFKISSVEESTKVEIELDTEDEGNAKRINMNTSNGRLANYSINNASLISVYASYLAPAVYIPYSGQDVSMKDDEMHYETCVPLNFGDEVVTFTVQTSDDKVATATVSEGQLVITGVGGGDATLTISANSTSYSASLNVSVHVSSSQRHLDHLVLSKSTDSLYKGQEFSYSGTITAVYDNSDEEVLEHSTVTFTGYDMTKTGNQTVTVSYTDGVTKSASYTLTVSQWTGELTIGNYYVLTSEYSEGEGNYKYAFAGIKSNVGAVVAYEETLRSENALLVEKGATYNSYAFKLSNGKYLSAANSNNLYGNSEEVNEASSWTVSISSGDCSINNVSFPTRRIRCNHNNGNPRFAAYTSNQKAVALVEVSVADIASHFTTNFMHPDISVDDKGTGACLGETGYYALAKAAFNVMPEESRNFFMTSTMYTNYKARLAAWAAANGDEFSEANLLVTNPASRVAFDTVSDDNTMIIVISIAAVSALAFTTLLVFKKKRQK